jgi:magnesium transporter
LFAFFIYQNIPLSLVMAMAMALTFLLAAILGVLIPLTLHKFGRDPATGSNVMITAVIDSGGFFIFLGLATVLLI